MSEFHCELCNLHTTRGRNYVRGKGNIKSKIMVIGEYPTRWDSDKGAPYMGEPMVRFNSALKTAGISRTDIFISYLVMCHPGDNKPSQDEMNTCGSYLNKEVSVIKPKVIVLLGDLAVKQILGKENSIAVRSKVWDAAECIRPFSFAASIVAGTDVEGKEIRTNAPGSFLLVTGPSPSEAVMNPSLQKSLERTLAKAVKLSEGSQVEALPLDYHYAHTEEDVFRMLTNIYTRCDREKELSFDIETSGLVGFKKMHSPGVSISLSISFSFQECEAYGLILRPKHRSERTIDALKRVLEHPIAKCGHNGNFDNVMLRYEFGIRVENYAFDTFVAAYALDQDSKEKGLDDVAATVRPDLGRWWEVAEKHLDKKTGYLNCPDDILLEYNCKDVDATLSVMYDMKKQLQENNKENLFYKILMPHYRELAEMQYHGVRLDVESAKALGKKMLAKIQASEEKCLAQVGRHPYWWGDVELAERNILKENFRPFNLLSSPELIQLIYTELKAPITVVSEKNKVPSVAEATLKPLAGQFPFISDLLSYKKDLKFNSGFVGWAAIKREKKSSNLSLFDEPEPEKEGVKVDGGGMLTCVGTDGRLHAEYKITGTVTGRISIVKPALQTIPKTPELRNLLIPKDGYVFVDADYKALELRILAILSGDPNFIEVFRKGLDPHSFTASKMFGIPIDLPDNATKEEADAYFVEWNKVNADARKKAKGVNFGIPYGEGADGLSNSLKVPKEEAQTWLDDWSTKAYPVASRWLQRTVDESRKAGGVTYSMNRFRRLTGFFSKKQSEQSEAERASKNTPIQGTGGDCTSIAISRIHNRFRREFGKGWDEKARIVLEVHDQVVVEVKKDLAEQVMGWVVEEMSAQMPFLPDTLKLEVDAEIKQKWGD